MPTTRGHTSIDKLLDLANVSIRDVPVGVPPDESFLDRRRREWEAWKLDMGEEACGEDGCAWPSAS